METPYTDHITASDYEHVYEPAEDTFLLLDALEADLPYLEHLQPQVCLEIGSGSGVIITALAKQFKNALCLATDINMHACKVSKQTARRNATFVDTIHCNLTDSLRAHTIDLLVFNPPYVVTPDDELRQQKFDNNFQHIRTKQNLVYSWAGGSNGRRIVDELLLRLNICMSRRSVLYLLLLRENNPDEVVQRLEELNFVALRFMERRIPGEYLYILKVTRK